MWRNGKWIRNLLMMGLIPSVLLLSITGEGCKGDKGTTSGSSGNSGSELISGGEWDIFTSSTVDHLEPVWLLCRHGSGLPTIYEPINLDSNLKVRGTMVRLTAKARNDLSPTLRVPGYQFIVIELISIEKI